MGDRKDGGGEFNKNFTWIWGEGEREDISHFVFVAEFQIKRAGFGWTTKN